MRSTILLLFAVLALATASTVPEGGKKAIADARDNAEKELRSKLNGTDSSVLIPPVKALMELASAGKKDQDAIAAFGDDEQVKPMLNASVIFWKKKIEEVIKPYVTNPKAYENLVIDFPYAPPDPSWNTTKAYKDAEQNITVIVKNATAELQKIYSTALKEIKAKNIKEMTCSSYSCLQLTRVFKELEEFVINNGQWAKHDSANGEIQVAMTSLKSEVENGKKEFQQSVANICKEHSSCISKKLT
ncbi:uncharacterized protein [Halyomorpha halys]|uniref:uncharacterized protein n=1 Tax=Halyomorpha halys TaxID=286706 RepID=UPI0006D522D6|nr:uncharacterized protein LOC106683274 [Halyomorpha halys]